MKHIGLTLVVCLIAYTWLAMAIHPDFKDLVLVWIGPFPLFIFDALLILAAASFAYLIALRIPTDPSAANRAALRLVGAYVLYQVVVVIPIAVLLHGVGPGDAYAGLNARIALLLIPFFYYVGLRYLSPDRLVAVVNVAAALLFLYCIFTYLAIGPQTAIEGGEVRLRLIWGGSTLLFGWLAFAGAFLQKKPFVGYAMGLAGVIGVMLVNHRSGYVALLATLITYMLLARSMTKRLLVLIVLVTFAGLLLAYVSPTVRESAIYSVTTMLNARSDATAWDRVERSQLAWEYVRVHPFGDYVWTRSFYLVNLGDQGFEPHNFIVQALDKQGWISSLLLFSLIGVLLWIGWRTARYSKLALVMTCYLVFYLVFCLFNTNFDAVENVTLFALAGALILHAHREARVQMHSAGTCSDEDSGPAGPSDQPPSLHEHPRKDAEGAPNDLPAQESRAVTGRALPARQAHCAAERNHSLPAMT